MCWILPGTSNFLNFVGSEDDRWGMWRSPNTKTNMVEGKGKGSSIS
jgi:hypothetical protein